MSRPEEVGIPKLVAMASRCRERYAPMLGIAVAALLPLFAPSAAHAYDLQATQVAGGLSAFESRWLVDHAQPRATGHIYTLTDQAWWDGDKYVCPMRAAIIPREGQGSSYGGNIVVWYDEERGTIRTEFTGDPIPSHVPVDKLRAEFDTYQSGTGGAFGWTELVNLQITPAARKWGPAHPVDPTVSAPFSIPGNGQLRLTYIVTNDHADHGGIRFRDMPGQTGEGAWPGDEIFSAKQPEKPETGDSCTIVSVRTVGPMKGARVTLTPHHSGGTMGWQFGGTSRIRLEYMRGTAAAVSMPAAGQTAPAGGGGSGGTGAGQTAPAGGGGSDVTGSNDQTEPLKGGDFIDALIGAAWKWLDPNDDGEHAEEDGTLTIGAPPGNHLHRDYNYDAPRQTVKVNGDFDMRVVVRANPMWDATGAGLRAFGPKRSLVRLDRMQGGDRQVVGLAAYDQAGERTALEVVNCGAKGVWLRLQRTGNSFTGWFCPVGEEKWIEVGTVTADIPARALVGVGIINEPAEWFEARFSQFTLTTE